MLRKKEDVTRKESYILKDALNYQRVNISFKLVYNNLT